MAKLKHEQRPSGQRDDYRFFRNEDTGKAFKALHEPRLAADGTPAVWLSVAPVDPDGHAELNLAGEPDTLAIVHTFTSAELADPQFSAEGRVATVLANLVETKERELKGRAQIKALSDLWKSAKPLPIAKQS